MTRDRDGIRKNRLLVVDDEPDITFSLKSVLSAHDYDVDAFEDVSDALAFFKAGEYDLLILDIKMPKLNGFELYSKFKEKDPQIKVLFLTALSELTEYSSYKKLVSPKWGERHFVKKPIENNDMLRIVGLMLTS